MDLLTKDSCTDNGNERTDWTMLKNIKLAYKLVSGFAVLLLMMGGIELKS